MDLSRALPTAILVLVIWVVAFINLAAVPADGFLNTPIHSADVSRLRLPDLPAGNGAHSLVSEVPRLPLSFVPNAGQTGPTVRFQAHDGTAGTLFFTPNEVLLSLSANDHGPAPSRHPSSGIRLRFQGANPDPHITGIDPLPGIVNYYIGNDPAQWRTNVPTYAGIVYHQLYPGIDLHYAGTGGVLKGTFTIAPGADPNQIRWRYIGAQSVAVDETSGGLRIALPTARDSDTTQSEIPNSKHRPEPVGGSEITEHAPVAWQTIAGRRVPVAVRYTIAPDGGISFAVDDYNPAYPLTVDPTLIYGTYLGGRGDDLAQDIAVDSEGNTYITGWGFVGIPFPWVRSPSAGSNVFVAKLNPSGTALLAVAFIGGASRGDRGLGIAVDDAGHVYVTGQTWSDDFPATSPIQPTFGGANDAFVMKLTSGSFSLVYSTYLGGSHWDQGHDIAADRAGNAYVVGHTWSTDFPTANPLQGSFGGHQDAIVAKIDPTGTALTYATYLGGSSWENGYAIAVDGAGDAYVTGATWSTDFPTANALQPAHGGGQSDAFVAKLNPTGTSFAYATYLGGSGSDNYGRNNPAGGGIAVDGAGNAYVTGATNSTDFPTASPLQASKSDDYDAFVTKLDANGATLVYSTYLGGSGFEQAYDIAVDSLGSVYITGLTESTDFPAVEAVQPAYGGGSSDAFVAKLNSTGADLAYATYLGGSADEKFSNADLGGGIAVDVSSNAYVLGQTYSADFPTANPLQPELGGELDAFLVKIGQVTPTPTSTLTATPTSTPTVTASSTPTATPTSTFTPTATPTPAPTATPTAQPTPTLRPRWHSYVPLVAKDRLGVPPTPGPTSNMCLTPAPEGVGWVVSSEPDSHHMGDDDVYAGVWEGDIYLRVIRFDLSAVPAQAGLSGVPTGAEILDARLTLTGQSTLYLTEGGAWWVHVLDSSVDVRWSDPDYSTVAEAPSLGPLLDLRDGDFELDAGQLRTGARSRLALTDALLVELNHRLRTIDSVTFRIEGPQSGEDNLCAWGAGYGTEGLRMPPVLSLVVSLD